MASPARAISRIFIFLAAFAMLAAAVDPSCSMSSEWDSGPISWLSLTFTALLVIMLFLSIAYMMGVLFLRIDWILWAKDEFYQMVVSVAIIVLISLFLQTTCAVSDSVAGDSPFAVSDAYLSGLIWEKSLQISTAAFTTGAEASYLAAFSAPLGAPPNAWSPLAGFAGIAKVMEFLFLISSTFFSSLFLQLVILKIAQGVMFKIILPIGIFFRVFPFLRNAGALFIAVALGFYLVFPMMYVVDKAIMDQTPVEAAAFNNAQSAHFAGVPDFLLGAAFGSLSGVYNPLSRAQEVANLIPQALFLPLLNITVTYAFIKSAHRILAQSFPSPFS